MQTGGEEKLEENVLDRPKQIYFGFKPRQHLLYQDLLLEGGFILRYSASICMQSLSFYFYFTLPSTICWFYLSFLAVLPYVFSLDCMDFLTSHRSTIIHFSYFSPLSSPEEQPPPPPPLLTSVATFLVSLPVCHFT